MLEEQDGVIKSRKEAKWQLEILLELLKSLS